MSLAIIVQNQANTQSGGSLQGYLSGTDSTAAADTFYGRRLTDMLINEDSTVSSFVASTGGAGAVSTAGQFVLTPGTYRIEADLSHNILVTTGNFVDGLYNVTSAAFEVYTGTAVPILGASLVGGAGNMMVRILGGFTVASTNKTYEIRQKCSSATLARELTCCGSNTTMTGTNVNSAAALNLYAVIKILKTS